MTTTFVQNTQINAQTSPKDVPYLLGESEQAGSRRIAFADLLLIALTGTLAQDDSILFTKATLVAFLT